MQVRINPASSIFANYALVGEVYLYRSLAYPEQADKGVALMRAHTSLDKEPNLNAFIALQPGCGMSEGSIVYLSDADQISMVKKAELVVTV